MAPGIGRSPRLWPRVPLPLAASCRPARPKSCRRCEDGSSWLQFLAEVTRFVLSMGDAADFGIASTFWSVSQTNLDTLRRDWKESSPSWEIGQSAVEAEFIPPSASSKARWHLRPMLKHIRVGIWTRLMDRGGVGATGGINAAKWCSVTDYWTILVILIGDSSR
jgi:hypothetical protein